jgi:superfamily II DNA or RNA helicase
MILRPYQAQLLEDVREAFVGRHSVCACLPTGAGKTAVFSEITRLARIRGHNVWIIVPRNELLDQASETLKGIGVPHGRIAVGHEESRAFNTHVVSKDTLIRRYDRIKMKPDFLIVDEAHLAIPRYCEIAERWPDAALLGVTATPERLDGVGLWPLYETLVQGPDIRELIELGFLTPMRYFCPPLKGIESLHKRGMDYDEKELSELFTKRKVYGQAIEHYRRHADGRPALVYCRSIKAAEETAQKFSAAGYHFENVDGTMSHKRRRTLIQALRDGEIQGLTNCEILTFGLDVPRVECVIMLRPTLSTTLYRQIIGRGLRPFPGKTECVILDHVSNLQEHGHPLEPHQWQFYGKEKRPRAKEASEASLRLCPEIDFMYCDKRSCLGCEHNKTGRKSLVVETVDGKLVEAHAPLELKKRQPEERREYVDRINAAVEKCNGLIHPGAVGDLLAIARELKRNEMWVYWRLSAGMRTVNVPVLSEIARQKGYKPGWVYFRRKDIRKRLDREARKNA